ncbi:MAG: hypothetical protein IJY25_03070 [Bacilli bacterium]|nr:hypothetical protein [Bacilli bacterium]
MIYFTKNDLHSNKTLYFVEICGRLFPQQREYLKTNSLEKLDKKIDSLDKQKLKYRVFLISKIEIANNI